MRTLARGALALIAVALVLSPAAAQVGNVGDAARTIPVVGSVAATVKGAPGILDNLICYNPNGVPVFVQVYDRTSVVDANTAAKFLVPVPSGVSYLPLSVNMVSGIQIRGTLGSTTSSPGPATSVPCTVTFR